MVSFSGSFVGTEVLHILKLKVAYSVLIVRFAYLLQIPQCFEQKRVWLNLGSAIPDSPRRDELETIDLKSPQEMSLKSYPDGISFTWGGGIM